MEKEWYVVNTYSGHESKVKEKLEMRASTMGMEDYIFRVVVPEETVIDDKGKEITCEPLFTFESEETKKQYVVYTDNSRDKEGNIRVFASIYTMTDKGNQLLPVTTDKEWKVIETILESIQEETKKAGE